MQNNLAKIFHIFRLMRFENPTGYLMSFFPAVFGLLLASRDISDLRYIPIFFVGSIAARAAGCIINDLLDQEFDKKVARTKARPIASGALSSKEALLILLGTLFICLAILLLLTRAAMILGVVALIMMSLYPLMKRITYFPQIFLGFTFNLGCLIGYATITNDVSPSAVIMYIACGFWTFGYDTIYAFMDIDDDKKIGIKSTAIFFEHSNYTAVIAISYVVFILLFVYATRSMINFSLVIALALSQIILVWSIYTLNVKKVSNCLMRFKINNYVGLILFLGLLLEKL